MDRLLLADCLGAIASYVESCEVPATRVVFCDALAFDAGYMRLEEIGGRVKLRGRGGTVLQPGIDLLERARRFSEGRTDPGDHGRVLRRFLRAARACDSAARRTRAAVRTESKGFSIPKTMPPYDAARLRNFPEDCGELRANFCKMEFQNRRSFRSYQNW